MKKLIFLIFIIINVNLFGQNYSSIIPDSTILNFLSWEIKHDGLSKIPSKKRHQKKIYHKIYLWSESEFIKLDSVELKNHGIVDAFSDYLFSENTLSFIGSDLDSVDIRYMIKQYQGINSNVNWNFDKDLVKIRKNSFRLHKKITYFYSIPIFSKNKNMVLLKKLVYCGKLCAEHAVYIYKKNEFGNWELIHLTNYWIS